jgi:hypothetical protein
MMPAQSANRLGKGRRPRNLKNCFDLHDRGRERQVTTPTVGSNGHVAARHERFLTGVRLDNPKAAYRERLDTLHT